jgi:NDP-hexose-3-ketoreductase
MDALRPPGTTDISPPSSQMGLAVWGLGQHAIHKILPAVAATAGLTLYGVCSRNPMTVADSARTWKCQGWTEPETMLKDPGVEIVYVASPIGLHAEQGRAALTARKHLWCEKPLTSRLSDTLSLLEQSRGLGLSVCEGHMYLHHPQFVRLVKYLAEGRLGRILSISCVFGIPRLTNPGFRSDPSLGGGALFDVGSYPISAVQALFPHDRETVKYSSMLWRDATPVDTDGVCVIRLSSGVDATLEWRINSAYRSEIQIWGEEGSLFTEKVFSKPATYAPFFRIRDLHGVETVEHAESANHFVRMFESFRAMIGDSPAMESERLAIARRAHVLDHVWSSSARTATRVSEW